MSKWDKLLIFNYFSGPVFIIMLFVGAIVGELQLLAIIIIGVIFCLSVLNLIYVFNKRLLYSQLSLVYSSFIMILTVFSPFFILNSNISAEIFAVFYNVIILPLFILNAYSTIYVITNSIS
ncbi:MAG: hypothetical protein VW394_07805 [Candidatus Heimdallarchaeota archaeon]